MLRSDTYWLMVNKIGIRRPGLFRVSKYWMHSTISVQMKNHLRISLGTMIPGTAHAFDVSLIL